jgi:hypothetical protein
MELPSIRKKAMCRVASTEDVLLEKGFQAGRRVIRELERFPRAHEEVPGVDITDTGKICGVAKKGSIVKELVLVGRQLKFVEIIDSWDELSFRREKALCESLRQDLRWV